MTQYVLKRVFSKGLIAFEVPEDWGAREAIKLELTKCHEKNNDYVLVSLQPPKRPRTTGKDSQNHHLNGHILQICNETKHSYNVIKYCIKMLAVEQMGYPYEELDGHIWPQGETECSTEDCAKLIEACHIWAAEHNVRLRED